MTITTTNDVMGIYIVVVAAVVVNVLDLTGFVVFVDVFLVASVVVDVDFDVSVVVDVVVFSCACGS